MPSYGSIKIDLITGKENKGSDVPDLKISMVLFGKTIFSKVIVL